MIGRLWYLGIAFRSVRGPKALIPFVLGPAAVLGWLVAVVMMDGPVDPLVDHLSLLAAVGGFSAVAGLLHGALSLRSKYPPLVIIGGGLCFLLSAFCIWQEPSLALLVRLSLPLILAGTMWSYCFYLSLYRGQERSSRLSVGDAFPDFRLPDSRNQQVTLPSMLAGGPALLVFYKGDW